MKKNPKPSKEQVEEQMDIFKNWVFDEEDYLGADTRTAFKTLPNGTRIYASVAREIFDKKAELKTLRFFYSGPPGHVVGSFGSKWIAIKKTEAVPSNTLFHGEKRSDRQVSVENLLSLHCSPLTCGQRCADWFLMRSFRVTGTMAASVSRTDNDLSAPTDEENRALMVKCVKSWYGRFKGTSAMHEGTMNEEPTADAFSLEPMVVDFYEIGLLQCNEFPFIAVSPDGVAMLQFNRGETHHACVEIKTRVAEKTVAQALNAMIAHGRFVHCAYDDVAFKKCVPSEHRHQVLHQAFIANFWHWCLRRSHVRRGWWWQNRADCADCRRLNFMFRKIVASCAPRSCDKARSGLVVQD